MRKLILQTLAAVALCMPPVATAGSITHSVNFPSSGLHVWQDTVGGEQYTRVSFDGNKTLSMPGAPELPVKYVRLVVPYNATNITVSCTHGTVTNLSVSNYVIPSEEPQIADETVSTPQPLAPDTVIYNNNAFYPANLAEIASEGYFMGENHVITVAMYPVQYNPVTGQLMHYGSLTATVNYDTSEYCPNLFMRNSATARYQDQVELAGLVDNPSQIASFAPHVLGPSLYPGNNAQGGLTNYEYNIITTRELEPAFKRLIALKRQKGYSAGTICVEDIMQNPLVNGGDVNRDASGNVVSVLTDSAGIIRAYLKEIYGGQSKFLLMGGKGVPFRYGKASGYSQVPTDFYFSELNTAWDLGTDPKTGNTFVKERKIVDTNAEYYVGRLLGSNNADINNYTSKLYRYELNPGNGDFSYLKRALYFEYRDMHKYNEVDSVSAIANSVFSGTNAYLIDTGEEVNMIKGSDIINMINVNQYGLIDLHGHGSPSSIKTHAHNDGAHKHVLRAYETVPLSPEHYYDDPGSGLNSLTNKYYPNILYSISCTTMPFDVYTSNSFSPPFTYNVKRNFGDSFISGKDYGGVAFLSNTRDGYYRKDFSDSSTGLEIEFFKCITNGYTHIGEAEALSKANYNKVYYALVHNLIGEPEFKMWTDMPTYYQNISVSRTNNSITVSGIDDSDSKVVYCDATLQQTQMPQSGSVIFQNVSPNGSIMIYKDNKIPYIADMAIQNEIVSDSRYIIANNVDIGSNLDNNRTIGNVIITNGKEYEIEAKGNVVIHNGFTVEKGAVFGIYPFAF